MVFGTQQLGVSLHIVTLVAPVAVYFLILGLLNSRRTPQVLSGRADFVLLLVTLSPLVAAPVRNWMGGSVPVTVLSVGLVSGAAWLLSPRGRSWVIYNMGPGEARRAVREALESLGCRPRRSGRGFVLEHSGAFVELGGFAILRNVSVRVVGGPDDLPERLEDALQRRIGSIPAQTQPMAVAMLLVATAMLIAPLTLVAHHAPEIVRLLTDMLP